MLATIQFAVQGCQWNFHCAFMARGANAHAWRTNKTSRISSIAWKNGIREKAAVPLAQPAILHSDATHRIRTYRGGRGFVQTSTFNHDRKYISMYWQLLHIGSIVISRIVGSLTYELFPHSSDSWIIFGNVSFYAAKSIWWNSIWTSPLRRRSDALWKGNAERLLTTAFAQLLTVLICSNRKYERWIEKIRIFPTTVRLLL